MVYWFNYLVVSASEAAALWRYRSFFIIIIIIKLLCSSKVVKLVT